ncbi:hypothetical protein EAO74_28590 [Streptomyces sp. gb1(2016)]|uniref:Uncharacterized protein n=1 Tax=Streptomyces sp. gb1(2016) TaxID=1828321 RepID=A0A652KLJ3_9ACTN|nr:hypothetical protein EAO74_28590 [Streptomyces sp. gb1(2016)]
MDRPASSTRYRVPPGVRPRTRALHRIRNLRWAVDFATSKHGDSTLRCHYAQAWSFFAGLAGRLPLVGTNPPAGPRSSR